MDAGGRLVMVTALGASLVLGLWMLLGRSPPGRSFGNYTRMVAPLRLAKLDLSGAKGADEGESVRGGLGGGTNRGSTNGGIEALRGTEMGDVGGLGGLGTRDRMHKLTSKAGAPRVDPNKAKKRRKIESNAGLLSVLGSRGGVSNAFGAHGLGRRPDQRRPKLNAWTASTEDARSTFAVDVDTASYSIARRALVEGGWPDPSMVRVEEVVNYFRYDYDPPHGEDEIFAIEADGARSPVDSTKHYMRVGIQAKVIEPPDRLPVNIVFLVDTSCSMTGSDRLPLAQNAMNIAVGQLTERDQVAITTYAGHVELKLRPTHGGNKGHIRRAIRDLNNQGGTAMQSGMIIAYMQAMRMRRPNTVTRVIVLSDGDANIGASSYKAIIDTVGGYVDEGIRLSTVGFGTGNYKDEMMEQLANQGNGNYYYVDSERMAQRVFRRDFVKMLQDVAQDVKIQVEFDPETVPTYRLVGYENRDIADHDFRNDHIDAGEIGAGHQVTALYELQLNPGVEHLGTVRVRAKRPAGQRAKEIAFEVPVAVVDRPFEQAPDDFRFAVAAMATAELWRQSPYAKAWSYRRVLSITDDVAGTDPDRAELAALLRRAR